MTEPVRPELVREYGTGLHSTTVYAMPNGEFHWDRRPGRHAPMAFRPVPDDIHVLLAGIEPLGNTRLALASPAGESMTYLAGGCETVATHLLRDGPTAELEPLLRGLGELLRAIHDRAPPTTVCTPPAGGLSRLEQWLAGRAPSPRAGYAGYALRRLLGPRRWETLRRWHHEVLADSGSGVAHGAPGLGALVVAESAATGAADLLTGEDVCLAPWYFDLGWVLGELVELKWNLAGDERGWQGLTEALFAGYGSDLGSAWNKMVTLRVALHVHDYIAYVGWHAEEFTRYSNFLRFLIDI